MNQECTGTERPRSVLWWGHSRRCLTCIVICFKSGSKPDWIVRIWQPASHIAFFYTTLLTPTTGTALRFRWIESFPASAIQNGNEPRMNADERGSERGRLRFPATLAPGIVRRRYAMLMPGVAGGGLCQARE